MTQSAAQSAGQSPPSPPQCLSQVLFLTPVLLPSQQRRPSLSTQTSDARYTVPSRALSLSRRSLSCFLLTPIQTHTPFGPLWCMLRHATVCVATARPSGVMDSYCVLQGFGELSLWAQLQQESLPFIMYRKVIVYIKMD